MVESGFPDREEINTPLPERAFKPVSFMGQKGMDGEARIERNEDEKLRSFAKS
jgi:hypothetical protein